MSNQESAFPIPDGAETMPGMTLRDYFAAKAMAAAIAHHGVYDEVQPIAAMSTATGHGYTAETVAEIAYAYADEMLAARERA